MAILTSDELTQLRQRVAASGNVRWTKAQANAVGQAVENWVQATLLSLNTAINVATAPLVLTPAEKLRFLAVWTLYFAKKQGVI